MSAPAKSPEVPFTPEGLNMLAKALQRASEIGQDKFTELDRRVTELEQEQA